MDMEPANLLSPTFNTLPFDVHYIVLDYFAAEQLVRPRACSGGTTRILTSILVLDKMDDRLSQMERNAAPKYAGSFPQLPSAPRCFNQGLFLPLYSGGDWLCVRQSGIGISSSLNSPRD